MSKMLFRKKDKKQPELDADTAALMLENVFEACDREPNSIPLSVLMSYSNYRRERFILQKILLLLVFLLFCHVPFLFVAPSFSVSNSNIGTQKDPIYEVTVNNSMFPVKRVTATMGGHNIPIYETDDHVYQVEPEANGELIITVTLSNNQENSLSILVEDVDVKAPELLSNSQEGNIISLFVADEDSGIDYEGVYAVNSDGVTVEPVSYNDETGQIDFAYPEYPMNIYIPDRADNVLHLVLTLY
jgi:hypothetical protein